MDIKYIQICCLPFCPSSVFFHTFYRFHDTYARSFVDIYKICIKIFVTDRITTFPDYTEQHVIERICFDTAINLSKFFHHIHIHILYITSRMLTMYVSAKKIQFVSAAAAATSAATATTFASHVKTVWAKPYGSTEGPPCVVKNRNLLSHPGDLRKEAHLIRMT